MGRTEPPLMFPAIAGTQIPTELTSLEELAATGDLETLRKDLWAVWKQPQQSIDLYRSCLYKAQLHDHVQIGSYLLSLGMTIAPSMFVSAVRSKSYDFLELYLSYGYDINALERESRPPALIYAVEDIDLVRWFLSHGADPNRGCHSDMTAMSYAVELAPLNVINFLFENGGSIRHGQLLHHAVVRQAPDRLVVVDMLLHQGLAINALKYQDKISDYNFHMAFGMGTPLHYAAEAGNLDVVELLLQRGADPFIRDSRGILVSERARKAEKKEIAEYLSSIPFKEPESDPMLGFRWADFH